MAKYINPSVNDKNLEEIQNNANQMRVCVGQPTDYNDAVSKTRVLVSMTPGDYTLAAGTAGSAGLGARKIIVAAKDNQTVSGADATVDHVALCDSGNTLLMLVTTTTPQLLTDGSSVDIGQWENEIREPT